jgi:hypothetical protein
MKLAPSCKLKWNAQAGLAVPQHTLLNGETALHKSESGQRMNAVSESRGKVGFIIEFASILDNL